MKARIEYINPRQPRTRGAVFAKIPAGLSTLELHIQRCLRNGYDISFISDLTRPAFLPRSHNSEPSAETGGQTKKESCP